MTIDIASHLPKDAAQAARQALTPTMGGLRGSTILAIAADVRRLQGEGREICNLTVGDFSPQQFPIPDVFTEQTVAAFRAGETNYPPADGMQVLKDAITGFYARELGLRYPPGSVVVASGARPPIYATWRLFVEPGDRTVSFLPMWNVGYYAHMCGSDHRFVQTTAETNFFPTVDQVRAELPQARLIVLNSPLNPTGTVIDPEVLRGIAEALVEENARRGGDRPCMLLFDQVYWMLTAHGRVHANPVALVPASAPYVVQVDAISKAFAATGLRVGWMVLPPYLQGKAKALVGHMGSWAPRPEQLATAWLLDHPDAIDEFMTPFKAGIVARLDKIYQAVQRMKASGLPVDAIEPQGAIYLSFHCALFAHGLRTNEEIRAFLLEEAGVAVVPFQAFDLQQDTGWFRMSIGAVGLDELDAALARLEAALQRRCG